MFFTAVSRQEINWQCIYEEHFIRPNLKNNETFSEAIDNE